MINKSLAILSLALLSIGLKGQNKLANQVLFTVEKDTVTAQEYMAVYNKNRDIGEEIDPKTPEEYLDLYINFKLKVHEAKTLGKDTLPSFLREFGSYREQLTKPYLSDKDVTEDLVREAYGRMKYDIRASHIMVALPKDPSPEDTALAYGKALTLRTKIMDGAFFKEVAQMNSDDTYSAKLGGDLGFFTVFGMVYPFETAAYETRQGKISMPVRSQFGYHIVKPVDKREARGKIQVAHLMLIDNNKTTTEQKDLVKTRVFEIYDKLKAGEDFITLVKQYSEDKTSAQLNGRLDEFGINKMYPEFENAAFSLQDSGQFSEPVKTQVGWHIIMLINKVGVSDFPQEQDQIRSKVERDIRAQQSQVSVMKRIKKDYAYKEYPAAYNQAFKQVDESFMSREYQLPAKIKNADRIVFEFANKKYTVKDLLTFTVAKQGRYSRGGSLKSQLYRMLKDYQDAELLAYEKSRLSQKYPDFRLLEREYYEGILLFDLTEEKVWRRAMTDTIGLSAYFESYRTNYMWETRYQMYVVDAASKKLAKKATKLLKKGNSRIAVMEALNVDSKLNLNIDSVSTELSEDAVTSEKKPGKTDIVTSNGRYKQAYILEIHSPRMKELDEAKGRVISDYQGFLEEAWLGELKTKFEVKVDSEVLAKVIKELE
jgi:peptidyl-prolyl cis-trans isomerase SurA